MSTPEFKPSKLGTKEYWDSVYEEELNNFNDTGDEGEVWFGMETVEKMVDWIQDNIPSSSNPAVLEGTPPQWDLILDKGTFDAIALSVKDENGKSPAAQYPARVKHLLRPGGYFLITSCNFTEEELKAEFVTEATGLVYHSRIQHPVYTYGGKSGSICASIAVQKPLLA